MSTLNLYTRAEIMDAVSDIIEILRRLRLRSGLTMKEIARRMGYANTSGYQRYENPVTFQNRDHLELSEARRLIAALEGEGDPPIDAAEIWSLLRLTPHEVALTLETKDDSELIDTKTLETVVYWLHEKDIFKELSPREAVDVVALACAVLKRHPDSTPEVMSSVISLEIERKRRLR